MEAATLIGLVSASTALVASVVGPAVTLSASRRQFSATAISVNRHKWIETLRDEMAELISLLATALVIKAEWKDKWEHGRGPLTDPNLLDKYRRIVFAQSRILLLINPADEDHRRLDQAIDVAARRLQSEEALDSEAENDIRTIVALGQMILKNEWHRVKEGT